jgi:cytochrome c553
MKPTSPLPRSLAVAAALLAASAASQSQTAAALETRSLAASCAACHGTDGKAVSGPGMLPLAGRSQADIVAQMQAFRDGSRSATVMHQIAKGYSEAQIAALAAYFANVR